MTKLINLIRQNDVKSSKISQILGIIILFLVFFELLFGDFHQVLITTVAVGSLSIIFIELFRLNFKLYLKSRLILILIYLLIFLIYILGILYTKGNGLITNIF